MRINSDNKSMDMEARDINYILPAYIRSYQFYSKNEIPTKIIFPMFVSVRAAGVDIPIEWVPPLDPVAAEIASDGNNVAEVTEEQEVVLDEKDKTIASLKAEVEALTQTGLGGKEMGGTQSSEPLGEKPSVTIPAPLEAIDEKETEEQTATRLGTRNGVKPVPPSKAKVAFNIDPDPTHQPSPDRKPGLPPGGDIGPGSGPSDMQPRDRRDQTRTAKDLQEGPDIDEAEEKKFEKEVKRDGQGRPIIEEKPGE